MPVCLPQRWQLYTRPDSSITASRAAPISGHPRRDRRYALVAAVDHRDGPEGPGAYPGIRFARPMIDPPTRPGQHAARADGVTGGASALSTGSPPAPTTCRSPPSTPLIHRWRRRSLVLPHQAVTTAYFHFSFGEEIWGRSAIFTRSARILGPIDTTRPSTIPTRPALARRQLAPRRQGIGLRAWPFSRRPPPPRPPLPALPAPACSFP